MKDKIFIPVIIVVILLISGLSKAYSGTGGDSDYSFIEFKFDNQIIVSGNTSKLLIKQILPQTIKNKQDIIELHMSPEPQKVFYVNGNKYAEYTFNNPERSFKLTVTGKAKVYHYDLDTAVKKNFYAPMTEDKSQYLQPERLIESANPLIIQTAKSLKRNRTIDTLKQIYDYVINNINYSGYNSDDIGALLALKTGKGDCSEFAELMVALCRANNIPARVVSGLTVPYSDTPKHAWVEVYTNKYGWIPFDPAKGGYGENSFSVLPPQYLYVSSVVNDTVLDNNSYLMYHYYGDPVKVTDTFSAREIKE